MIGHVVQVASSILVVLATATFILVFARERYWASTAMGRSLMVAAVGTLLLASQGLMLTVLGPHYPGRNWYVVAGRVLVAAAFAQRIVVLERARRGDGS